MHTPVVTNLSSRTGVLFAICLFPLTLRACWIYRLVFGICRVLFQMRVLLSNVLCLSRTCDSLSLSLSRNSVLVPCCMYLEKKVDILDTTSLALLVWIINTLMNMTYKYLEIRVRVMWKACVCVRVCVCVCVRVMCNAPAKAAVVLEQLSPRFAMPPHLHSLFMYVCCVCGEWCECVCVCVCVWCVYVCIYVQMCVSECAWGVAVRRKRARKRQRERKWGWVRECVCVCKHLYSHTYSYTCTCTQVCIYQ